MAEIEGNWQPAKFYCSEIKFLSKGQWTYGPTYCLSIDTHICSKRYNVVYF